MRILFLTNKETAPSTRWRVHQLIPHLVRADFQCDVVEMAGGMVGKLAEIQRASEYDIVVLQKRLLPKLLMHRLRALAKRLIFEFDDVLFLKRSESGVRVSTTRERRFRRTLHLADAVVTANETLAEIARRYAPDPERVHVLPTAVDIAKWTPRGPARREGRLTIGWVGTATHLGSLDIVASPLHKLCRRHEEIDVKVVCDVPPALDGVRVRHQPYSPETEVAEVRSFDVAILPWVEDPWTRGKVPAKLLAYMAAGIPTVASDVGAHRGYIRHGENGFLAGTLSSWEEAIERLIDAPDLRGAVGTRARETAEQEYSLESVVPRHLALFRSLEGVPS
ncbi:MAG: glycosyltransferase family 4 protein [Planctomycetes bacterium]|nr:glycosyltransferase family 4 protein [Planctomycetota bacterium]